jgi:hypothetical protein
MPLSPKVRMCSTVRAASSWSRAFSYTSIDCGVQATPIQIRGMGPHLSKALSARLFWSTVNYEVPYPELDGEPQQVM